MIGSSRETVTRMFARFKREHLVKVDASASTTLPTEPASKAYSLGRRQRIVMTM